jgi:diguanylate cyclase (GGDEF)-like protein
MFDGLTKLHTRKYLLEYSHREFSRVERYGEIFSIIMIDIDHFKYFNDTYGHIMGDEILKRLASLLKSNVRQGDVVARYGGEEFIVLLPGTDKDGATLTAEKLRTVVERELLINIVSNDTEIVTITAGVASYPTDGKTIEDIIATADRFLYLGKESGRNQVINEVLEDINLVEKRLNGRYRTALKITRGFNQIQSIEIKLCDDDWKICTLRDVSKMGFKGEVEFETNIGDIYPGKAILDSEAQISYIFSMRIVNSRKIQHNRYQIGVEIIDGYKNWKRMYTLITHL